MCTLFPNSNVFNLPIIIGNHDPILTTKYTFKFENWWTCEDDFQGVSQNAWNATTNKSFHARTTNFAGPLKRWCKKKKPI
jgi:hypothetical protein